MRKNNAASHCGMLGKPYLNTPARTVYKDDVIVDEYLRESSKNIGTTKLFGGFNILLYVCCSLHKYSIAMANHCLCWVEDLVD